MSILLPPDLETRIAALAASTHREPEAVLADLVEAALDRHEDQAKVGALRSALEEGERSGRADYSLDRLLTELDDETAH
jgi:predicted transcriptional regulator